MVVVPVVPATVVATAGTVVATAGTVVVPATVVATGTVLATTVGIMKLSLTDTQCGIMSGLADISKGKVKLSM